MFILPDVKIAVLFTPRTGSHTLHNLLWGLCRDRLAEPFNRTHGFNLDPQAEDGMHFHLGWWYVQETYRHYNIKNYRCFAFYRHPESWFLSALKYMHGQNPQQFHGNMSPRAFWEAETNMKTQISIIGSRERVSGDNTELLNYHDFTNEMIRLFKELEVDLTPEIIKEYTMRNPGYPFDRVLTEKDRTQIRKYWWEDYHWLEYKGIDLPK